MTLSEQKEKKPPYEELSATLLTDQPKEIFDDFIKYLKSVKLQPKWYATNAYNVKFKGKMILRFTLNTDNTVSLFFTVGKAGDMDATISSLSPDIQKFYFDNLRRCTECNPSHNGGKKVTILGTVYGCCAEPEMLIKNPSMEQVEYLKKFVQARKEKINAYSA